ncbi:MAG TPA: BTAD domain-containing putative transcriptional regulator, partial [Gemmatimonadales bacterium]|nr:BTAD domain-containing putative transcriptional regulator [Gemmatimonadales bacterium]
LITLGRLALLRPDGTEESSLVTRRRKLAVLTLLALSRRPFTRDRLTALFWGEQDDDRARHSLADTLSHLRRILGKDAITLRQEEIALGPGIPLVVDAQEFRAAVAAKDPIRACALYTGPFLEGVHVPDAADFDDWASREREQLARAFAEAAAAATTLHAASGAHAAQAETAARWLAAEPLSDDAAVALLAGLAGPATPAALARAVAEFDRLAGRLKRDFELGPGPRARAMAERLRAELATAAPPTDEPRPPVSGSTADPVRPTRRWPLAAAAGAAVLAVAALVVVTRSPRPAAARPRPVLALAQVRTTRPGAPEGWLSDGLPQMIAADLSRSSAVDVVAPERVRELRARASQGDDPLSPAAVADLGRRLGADWVVTGALTPADTALILELDVVDVARARLARVIVASAPEPLALADGAAARLLSFLNATGPGPHLASVETASVEAYQHYVTGENALQEGRVADAQAEFDRAVALDSGFVSAVLARLAMARGGDDWPLVDRLQRLFERHASRASDWDRASEAVERSMHAGERDRSEALGRALVAAFPTDPRAYALLADTYVNHGRWDAADTVLQRELALDSLALEAGSGPCAPCVGYGGLVAVRVTRGALPDAVKAAFRWVGLQPDLPVAWDNLSTALSYGGRFDEAIEAEERALALSRNESGYQDRMVRTLLMARHYAAVDSALAVWRRIGGPELRGSEEDISAIYLRERGRYRAALAEMDSVRMVDPAIGKGLDLMRSNTLTRLGRPRQAAAVMTPIIRSVPERVTNGDEARARAWHWALKAAALSAAGDTVALAAIGDSIDRVARLSYYGRDWLLPAAVQGMIAYDGGRWQAAVDALQHARWGVAGWTEVNALLGEAYLKLGNADSAIAVFRAGYAAPLDAMGRYEPRSELDYGMARGFLAAGRRDSAEAYIGRLQEAWSDADPEVRARLQALVASAH